MKVEGKEENNSGLQFKSYYLVLFVLGILIISASILAASIYLFISPGVTSGIVFALVIILLLISPVTIAIIFYFKKIKGYKSVSSEKKKIKLVESERIDLIDN